MKREVPVESTVWREIPGYHFRYRISDQAEVQRYVASKDLWKPKQAYRHTKFHSRLFVKLTVQPNQNVEVPLVKLMANAFMGGYEAHLGQKLTHRNGMVTDCALENLVWTTQSAIGKRYGGNCRKSVEKIDRDGNVVALYRSTLECAQAEFIDRKTLWRIINGKVKDPYATTGYTYRYER